LLRRVRAKASDVRPHTELPRERWSIFSFATASSPHHDILWSMRTREAFLLELHASRVRVGGCALVFDLVKRLATRLFEVV
jgi:hypothetical protein